MHKEPFFMEYAVCLATSYKKSCFPVQRLNDFLPKNQYYVNIFHFLKNGIIACGLLHFPASDGKDDAGHQEAFMLQEGL